MFQQLILYFLGLSFSLATTCHSWHCDLMSLQEAISIGDVTYRQVCPQLPFKFKPLPFSNDHYLHPYEGIFHETFILHIPNGQVFGADGWVLVKDKLISELIWQNVLPSQWMLQEIKKQHPIQSITGRVAVIAQSGYTYYYHWLLEVLGRLALLEMQGIDYDYLYVPTISAFMKETLELWGVPPEKIISADNKIYQATELITPSLVAKVIVNGCPRLAHYISEEIVFYVQQKLLAAAKLREEGSVPFSKKIFISRKDATARRMLNEDEVFELFRSQGFERYELSQLPVVQQILLFNQADIIVGSLGSGLSNILFCNKEARIIDLFQARRDGCIYYLGQTLNLNYQCVKTVEFIDQNDGQYDSVVPLEIIQSLIEKIR